MQGHTNQGYYRASSNRGIRSKGHAIVREACRCDPQVAFKLVCPVMFEAGTVGSDDGEASPVRSIKPSGANKDVEGELFTVFTYTASLCEFCHCAVDSSHIVFAHCLQYFVSDIV